jgi:dipeptidyl aminopeptidase/acylaminoacyl peptidase
MVVYASDGAGEGELDLWLQRTSGGQPILLTNDAADDREPDFSPEVIARDGTQVAYSVDDGPRVVGYVVPTAGGSTRQVCECMLQGWFPDNRRILALDGAATSKRIRVIDVVNRSEAALLAPATLLVGRADISPDGRWLAFGADRKVWIAPARPGNPPGEHEWVTVLNRAEQSAARVWMVARWTAALSAARTRRLSRSLCATDRSGPRHACWRALRRPTPARPAASVGIHAIRQRDRQQRLRLQPVRDDGSIWLLEPDPASRRTRTVNE